MQWVCIWHIMEVLKGLSITTDGRSPACLFVVYPYDIGESSGDALVPGFWKPFWNLPLTVFLGLLIPGVARWFWDTLFLGAGLGEFISPFSLKRLQSHAGWFFAEMK